MSTPTEPASIAPPPAQVIDDLPCRTCGYNLRTLAKDGVCPECATPVVASLRSELLREADPNWLRRMRSGCELAYAGIWAAWIWFIFFQGFHAGLFVTFAIPGAAAAAALGTWMLTIPDPSGIGEDRYGRLRVWARALGIAQFAAVLVSSLSRSAHLSVYPLCEGSEMFARFAWGATLLWYLDRLGRRTWRSKISTGYRIQAFLFVGMSAVSMAAWIALCIGTGPRSPVPWALGIPFSWLNIFFLYGAVSAFDKVLKAEVKAATQSTGPSVWRTAGSFLYSAKQLFRRKNGRDQ